MKSHAFFMVAWSAMLGASLLEMLIFAMIDPTQYLASKTRLAFLHTVFIRYRFSHFG